MSGWEYYNHAMISTYPLDEPADIGIIKNGEIWKGKGRKALFALWTTDFDSRNKTAWWYCVKILSLILIY